MTNDFKSNKSSGGRLSKEEFAAKKKAEREAVFKVIDDTAKDIVTDPDKFKAYLDTQSSLDRYSANNALLIHSQYPSAKKLKDFDDWGKEKVKINKGAKSISIIEPYEYKKKDGGTRISYNVKKVFDVSQTNARKTPAVTANKDPRKLITAMIEASPVEVRAYDELPYPNTAAYYSNDKQMILVGRGIGDSVLVCQTLAQELGHAQLSINSDKYSRSEMGFKAVCIGYMLCKKYGVDTNVFAINRIPEEYKTMTPKEIRDDLSKMRNAMEKIHSEIYKVMSQKEKERSGGYER